MITSQTSPPKYLQEDSLSQECKKLLSTLSKEKGWTIGIIYLRIPRILDITKIDPRCYCMSTIISSSTDIILVTTPKSGTTWLKSLLFTLVNRMKHSVFEQNHPLLVKNPHVLVPFLEHTLYVDGRVPDFSSFTSPRLLATHVPFASLPKYVQNSKTILLDHKDINSIEEMFDLFCNGVNIYGPFWDHMLDYWKQSIENPNKVLFLMYEEMKEKPKIQLKRLVEFLECQFSIEEENCGVVDEILKMCSFENLSNLEVNTNEKLSTGEGNTNILS
ncbi:hypothetical protein H5410_013713 [Solanum commersonii]|uniref:Sulfotransferase n=1 Tax=Solanum commersonii TaxID=4109 RepID=A0A9J5ZNZ7_SOLCO|nr:hypothetical protein H5410_013713 [Solanum commersonii]